MGNSLKEQLKLVFVVSILGVLAIEPAAGAGARIRLDAPTGEGRVLDYAQIVDDSDATRITYLAQTLQEDLGIPLYVVTIDSMLAHSSSVMPIETYARVLFEQWGRNESFAAREHWHMGILLLVSPGDRCARIELGRNWKGNADPYCQKIMDGVMVPEFRSDRFSEGVLEGVRALDRLARGDRPSLGPNPWEQIASIAILASVASLFVLWIYGMFAGWFPKGSGGASHHDNWDRGYSGGGGGYGGGGGATGSW